MTTRIRTVLLTSAFALTVAGAIAGLTLSGETKEASRDETCAHAAWPMIPAACLEGGHGQAVRVISADKVAVGADMRARFRIAFD